MFEIALLFLLSLNSQSVTVSENTFPGTEEFVMKQKKHNMKM